MSSSLLLQEFQVSVGWFVRKGNNWQYICYFFSGEKCLRDFFSKQDGAFLCSIVNIHIQRHTIVLTQPQIRRNPVLFWKSSIICHYHSMPLLGIFWHCFLSMRYCCWVCNLFKIFSGLQRKVEIVPSEAKSYFQNKSFSLFWRLATFNIIHILQYSINSQVLV